MRAPVVSARGSVTLRQLVLVTLTDSSGVSGRGEAAPLPRYDGVGAGDVVRALEDWRARGSWSRDPDMLPQAAAAIDMALWDLEGRRAGVPVWRLLGASAAPSIEVNATIASIDRAGAGAEAAAAARAGFRCLKMKVGVGDDAGRVAAVRAAAGPSTAIRLDANGVWSVSEAVANLRALAPARIELCEEPASGIEGCARVAASLDVPIALDESSASPGALDRRVCAGVCLKLSRCGGVSGLIEAARRARQAGYEVYLASTYDGPLGIAGALHAAAVIAPDRPSGLATLSLFERTPAFGPVDGRLSPPEGPGLGTRL